MFNRKKELLDYVEELGGEYKKAVEAIPDILEEPGKKFIESERLLLKNIECGELLVPVIGGFSAGKSTALNKVIGDAILPVAVTAETAIPAELRYSEDEHIQAITVDGQSERHPVSALADLSANAERYDVVRIYLSRTELKRLLPYTLIDMPGFDSPFEHHNKAILRYINKGSYYLYMINVKDGALRRQDMSRLNEISDKGRGFTVFLTKKDLAADAEINDVRGAITGQIDDEFGGEAKIECIGLDDTDAITEVLNAIDPNKLFNDLLIDGVKAHYYSASSDINTALSALKNSKDESRRDIESLKDSLKMISEERDHQLRSIGSGYAKDVEKTITSRIEKELRGSVNDLASLAKINQDAMGRAISDIVRRSLVDEFQKATGKVSADVARSMSEALNVTVSPDFRLGDDWVQSIASVIHSSAMDALLGVGEKISGEADSEGNGNNGTVIAGAISSFAAVVPHPVVKVALMILPGIINGLYQSYSDSREKERWSDKIINHLIPDVVRQIRSQVSENIEKMMAGITQEIGAQFEDKINEKKKILEARQDEVDARAEDVERAVLVLEAVRKNINSLTEGKVI